MFLYSPVKANSRSNHAQVLLEVIAAVALVSVALTAIIESLVSNYKASVLSREYTRALFLLEDRGQALYLTGANSGSSGEGLCSSTEKVFRCKAEISKLNNSPNSTLSEASVSVSWDSGKRGRNLLMSTFIAGD